MCVPTLLWNITKFENADHGDINSFEDSNFIKLCGVDDCKLMKLNRAGKYVEKKKPGVITVKMEEKL